MNTRIRIQLYTILWSDMNFNRLHMTLVYAGVIRPLYARYVHGVIHSTLITYSQNGWTVRPNSTSSKRPDWLELRWHTFPRASMNPRRSSTYLRRIETMIEVIHCGRSGFEFRRDTRSLITGSNNNRRSCEKQHLINIDAVICIVFAYMKIINCIECWMAGQNTTL